LIFFLLPEGHSCLQIYLLSEFLYEKDDPFSA
jgi:hypothetical protein